MKIQSYIEILRPSHWFKNVVVLLGALAAIIHFKIHSSPFIVIGHALIVTLLACLISSVNYSINDLADEKGDAQHPTKKDRVVPNRRVSKRRLLAMIFFLLIISFSITLLFYEPMETATLLLLFIAGIIYNLKPLRLKDLPVLDVIAESVNNPIRILIGWFAVAPSHSFPPVSFLLLFWAAGAVLMSAKRYAELEFFLHYHKKKRLVLYRNSFKTYTNKRIFAMVFFYLLMTIIFFILFSIEFKRSLLIALPFMIGFFIWFLRVMNDNDSVFREPEKAFAKKPLFSISALVLFLLLTILALSV